MSISVKRFFFKFIEFKENENLLKARLIFIG